MIISVPTAVPAHEGDEDTPAPVHPVLFSHPNPDTPAKRQPSTKPDDEDTPRYQDVLFRAPRT
ncbi:MAG TPA: hypothetical protein VG317_19395 [Pseudonocardiaceae bacterium]|jgi:hypothetical protein|nr:hypothetical protein [Pseudonocardiaceae bacterium]